MEPEPKRRRKMVASDSSSSDSESASESSSSATPPKELQPVKEEQEEEVDPALMEEFPEDDHEETDEQKEQRQLQIVRAAQLRRNHLMYLLSDIPERHLFGLIRGSFVLIKAWNWICQHVAASSCTALIKSRDEKSTLLRWLQNASTGNAIRLPDGGEQRGSRSGDGREAVCCL
eukprot:Skav212203  [mRNA]  locus=scaffold754:749627:751109:+ [translate_table: standard]